MRLWGTAVLFLVSLAGTLLWGVWPLQPLWSSRVWLGISILGVFIWGREFWDERKKRHKDRRGRLIGGCLAGILRIGKMVSTLVRRIKPRVRLIPEPA